MQAFYIVKSIAAEITDPANITAKDTKSYFGVLYKNNTRKWICRFYFNSPRRKYIGLHVADKKEEKFPIERLEDIYSFRGQIQEVIARLESNQ